MKPKLNLSKFLMILSEKGYCEYDHVVYVAGGAVLQVLENDNDQINNESYIRNLTRTKIVCSNTEEKDRLVAIFNRYGFTPTDKKFIIL